MRPRRLKWLAATWILIAVLGYAAGRLHQRDTVKAYQDLSGTLEHMIARYETANAVMWDALGVIVTPADR